MSQTTLSEKRVHMADLHSDHQLWLNTLRFCKDEIGIFDKRMEDIARRNPGREVMAELEHFQNRYIREREVIDELRHDIKQHENHLEKFAMDHPVASDHVLFTDHQGLRDRIHTFEKLYHELKVEFMRWLADRM
ncbi:MAG TPA: hypothetical protein PJ983_03455 [Flavobacteriales bacterium]|nr:hypothetical protein [Flavobacteriales bacterium]